MMTRRVATWTIALFASKDHVWRRIMTLLLAAVLLGAGLLSASSRHSTSMQPRRPSSILYLPTPEPSHGDTCEPNDSWEDACGPLAPGAVYQFYILCRDGPEIDDDLYYIHVGKTDPMAISLTSIPRDTDYDLYLYDSKGEFLDFSNKSGNADEHILYTPGAIGKYFIRVYPWQGCSDTDPYSLVASYTPPPPPVTWRHTPHERDITLTVGQCQIFAVQAADEDCDLRGVEWYVNGEHQISHFTLSGCS